MGMKETMNEAVQKWLDDNDLDYIVAETHADVIMLRPKDADARPMLLFKTLAGWQPWVYADAEEEGWSELYDLDEVT